MRVDAEYLAAFHLAGETIRAKGFKTNSMKGRKTASGLLRGLIIGVHSRPFAVLSKSYWPRSRRHPEFQESTVRMETSSVTKEPRIDANERQWFVLIAKSE